jgi:hypothetical protein
MRVCVEGMPCRRESASFFSRHPIDHWHLPLSHRDYRRLNHRVSSELPDLRPVPPCGTAARAASPAPASRSSRQTRFHLLVRSLVLSNQRCRSYSPKHRRADYHPAWTTPASSATMRTPEQSVSGDTAEREKYLLGLLAVAGVEGSREADTAPACRRRARHQLL